MTKKSVLDSGLTVLTTHDKGSQAVTIGFFVNAGSVHEPNGKNGIAHFIEHLFFKGTKKRTSTEISKSIEGIGGIINACTYYDYTKYYVTVPKKFYTVGLDVLCDMITNSIFDSEQIERERKVIFEEIKMYNDDPESRTIEEVYKNIMINHLHRQSIIGTKETVSSITREDILSFIEENYVAGNIILSIIGDIDHDKIVRYINRNYQFNKGNKLVREKCELKKPNANNIEINASIEQANLSFGFLGVMEEHKDSAALDVLATIFGGNSSSRLYQKVREERGLVYTISFWSQNYSESGYLCGYAGLDPEYLDEVKEIILNEIEDFKNNVVNDEELNLAKRYIEGTTRISMEKKSVYNDFIAFKELFDYNDDLEDYINRINNVKKEDIIEVANKYLNKENLVMVSLYNK